MLLTRARALTVMPVLALLLATLQPARADVGNATKGETLARTLCAECHLNPAQGEKRGPMGIPGFVAVANRPLQTAEGVVEWLQSIPPMMPNHHLTQDEMYDLAAFIMSLRQEPSK